MLVRANSSCVIKGFEGELTDYYKPTESGLIVVGTGMGGCWNVLVGGNAR